MYLFCIDLLPGKYLPRFLIEKVKNAKLHVRDNSKL